MFVTWVMARANDILADARGQPMEAKWLLDTLIDVPVEMTPSDGARERHTFRLHVRSWRDTFQSDRVQHVSTPIRRPTARAAYRWVLVFFWTRCFKRIRPVSQ